MSKDKLDKQGQLWLWSRSYKGSFRNGEEDNVIDFKTTKTRKHFCWGIISRLFLTCFNLQNVRKESRENSKKIKPKRNSFI